MSVSNSTDAAEGAAGVAGSDSLSSARRKLAQGDTPFLLEDLPPVESTLWEEIRTTYDLSLQEMSALQNHACRPRPRGILPRVAPGNGEVYRINDERVRARFTITNKIDQFHHITVEAELLVDSGAQSELKLPARKVVELGLQKTGQETSVMGRVMGTTNHTGTVLAFWPVLVTATFDRNGVEEERSAMLNVRCTKSDYEDLAAAADAPLAAAAGNQTSPVQTPTSASVTTTPTESGGHITVVRLTLVKHRPNDRRDEQAVLGMDALKKMGLHLNPEQQQLEIEEEEMLDPEW